jgi:hypothetical protein
VEALVPVIQNAVHRLLVLAYFLAPFAALGGLVALVIAWRVMRALERATHAVEQFVEDQVQNADTKDQPPQ